ncbi:MAG: creatininase family protein [Planctomycetota bacterium]|nr:MAG: creatininase family protein [Planctomycetota bacterium]
MKKLIASLLLLSALLSVLSAALFAAPEADPSVQNLPVKYEQLTALQFISAVRKSAGTCIIPFGVLEKHGPHLPLGTDLLDVREIALRAAKAEYTLVFPQYYFGQIAEGKHQPGTIAYNHKLIWDLLQETCDELARNGIRKIIIVNGHGGNNHFLRFFCQAQLEKRTNYAVYLFAPKDDPELQDKIKKLRKTDTSGHACELETSVLMAHRPELVHLEKAEQQSGEDQKRLNELNDTYVGIWWYASFPNHYAGDGSLATPELGELYINGKVDQLTKMIRTVKKDEKVQNLQNRFFDEAEKPLETKQ